jgi:hypothetical protein
VSGLTAVGGVLTLSPDALSPRPGLVPPKQPKPSKSGATVTAPQPTKAAKATRAAKTSKAAKAAKVTSTRTTTPSKRAASSTASSALARG